MCQINQVLLSCLTGNWGSTLRTNKKQNQPTVLFTYYTYTKFFETTSLCDTHVLTDSCIFYHLQYTTLCL